MGWLPQSDHSYPFFILLEQDFMVSLFWFIFVLFTRDEARRVYFFFSLELLPRNSHHLLYEKIWNGTLWLLLFKQALFFQERSIHKCTLEILSCSWKYGPGKIRFCSHANILFNLCHWQSILFPETISFLSRVYNLKSKSRMQRTSQKKDYSFYILKCTCSLLPM